MKIMIGNQTGATLIVSLLLLIALTIISLSAMNMSITEQKISANSQHKMEALQKAQSVIDATLVVPGVASDRFKVIGTTDYRICGQNPDPDKLRDECNENFVLTGLDDIVTSDVVVTSDIIRMDPDTLPAPRGIDTSADKYSVALFRVEGHYDNSANGFGRTTVSQGYLVLVPKGGQ